MGSRGRVAGNWNIEAMEMKIQYEIKSKSTRRNHACKTTKTCFRVIHPVHNDLVKKPTIQNHHYCHCGSCHQGTYRADHTPKRYKDLGYSTICVQHRVYAKRLGNHLNSMLRWRPLPLLLTLTLPCLVNDRKTLTSICSTTGACTPLISTFGESHTKPLN